MALFSKKKTFPVLKGEITTEDEILGYLDELQRQRTPIEISIKGKVWRSEIHFIDDKARTIGIQNQKGMSEYQEKNVIVGFAMDNSWFVFASVLELKKGKLVLGIPLAIKHQERRKSPRTRFTHREEVSVTVLQDFGVGIGVFGKAVDISVGGLCVRATRALRLEDESEIRPNEHMYKKGQTLAIVKVSGIKGIPEFEVSGVVNRITGGPGNCMVVIEFHKLKSELKIAIEHFIKPRSMPFSLKRRSRKKRLEFEARRKKEMEAEKEAEEARKKEVQQETQEKKVEDAATLKDQLFKSLQQKKSANQKKILSFGDEFLPLLKDIEKNSGLNWTHLDDPKTIPGHLKLNPIQHFLISSAFNEKTMLVFLKKIYQLGLLKNTKVSLVLKEDLPVRERMAFNNLGIKIILLDPEETPDQVIKKITT